MNNSNFFSDLRCRLDALDRMDESRNVLSEGKRTQAARQALDVAMATPGGILEKVKAAFPLLAQMLGYSFKVFGAIAAPAEAVVFIINAIANINIGILEYSTMVLTQPSIFMSHVLGFSEILLDAGMIVSTGSAFFLFTVLFFIGKYLINKYKGDPMSPEEAKEHLDFINNYDRDHGID